MSNQNEKLFSTRNMCYVGLMTAVIAIMAQISIPMPAGVPMTMQTFAITLAAVVLGAKLSTISTTIYVLLGAVGLPVLSPITPIALSVTELKPLYEDLKPSATNTPNGVASASNTARMRTKTTIQP